ncbi:hypothetical protein L195_g053308 [Trifolium pratense]|uniref:Uncharacterized protein n=1 Tax=Trifolium pratense TaxID=57577 RepID=A0A2K3K9R7_TRIPR|nr:hypothetical protein L195_g053308 [Trifolium pratense]
MDKINNILIRLKGKKGETVVASSMRKWRQRPRSSVRPSIWIEVDPLELEEEQGVK